MPPAAGPRAGLALFKSMQSVPQSVHNSLVSLKALDEKFSAAHERYEQNALAHLSKAQADSDGLRRLRSEQRALLLLADQKLQVATDAHALVDGLVAIGDAAVLDRRSGAVATRLATATDTTMK